MPDDKKITIAVLNGKYKTGAPILYELIKHPNVVLKIGLGSGKPVHPFFIPLLQAGTVIYSDTDLAGLLSNTDIVISFTASCAGLQSQVNKIIPMAAKSGVKLFVPCEFGMDWDEITQREKEVGEQPLVKLRKEAVEECERLGMGCLKVLCGLIPENMLVDGQQHPYIPERSTWNWKLAERKVKILGDGNQPITWTPINYLAQSISSLLSSYTPTLSPQTQTIRLSGYTLTQNDLISKYNELMGVKLDVEYVSLDQVIQDEKEMWDSVEGKGVTSGEGVVNYWTEWPFFIQAEMAKGNALLTGDITTVEGVVLPGWKEIFEGLPVEV